MRCIFLFLSLLLRFETISIFIYLNSLIQLYNIYEYIYGYTVAPDTVQDGSRKGKHTYVKHNEGNNSIRH